MNALQTLSDARAFFSQKAYPEALEICEALLSRNGPQGDVLTLQALIQKQSGKLEDAGKSMELALHENPDHPGMLFTAALINRKLENLDLAKKQAMKAAREADGNAQIICQCANILGSIGEPQKALQILEGFLQRHEDQPEAWYLVGKFQLGLGNRDAAEYAVKKCIALQPDHARATKLLERIGERES